MKKNIKRKFLSISNLLIGIISLASYSVIASSHILIATPPSDQNGSRQLVEIASDAHKQIAALSYSFLFGADESTLVIINSLTNSNDGCQVLVIDKKTSTTIANFNLFGIRPVRRIKPFENLIAVQTEKSMAYFPVSDENNHCYGFAGITWNTNESHLTAIVSNGFAGDISSFTAFPFGFATLGFGAQITLFDFNSTAEKLRCVLQDNSKADSLISRQIYYVPSIGLMEYCQGAHYRLADTNFSTIFVNPKKILSSDVNSKIFFRTFSEKPCLIWGEDKSESKPTDSLISDVVVFNLSSGIEFFRKSLGTTTAQIFPDMTGSKIYFVNLKNKSISAVDVESQSIASFAPIDWINGNGLSIIDVY